MLLAYMKLRWCLRQEPARRPVSRESCESLAGRTALNLNLNIVDISNADGNALNLLFRRSRPLEIVYKVCIQS